MQVGIRELKGHTSAVIRRVAAGETIDVTDRGRPVARIVPLKGEDDWWDQMVAEGKLIPATRHDMAELLRDMPPPMPGEKSMFEALMELRADDR